MEKAKIPSLQSSRPTRRRLIGGLAIAIGGLASSAEIWAKPQQTAVAEAPPNPAHEKLTSLHQEVTFFAIPQRIYEILLDSKQFAAFTGLAADIDPKVGGAFSTFGGLIVGRNIELIPNQRIVQAWRPTHWGPGVYSIVKFELKPQGSGTLLVLDHTGFPEGDFDGLDTGWPPRYWNPLKKFLG